MPILEDVIFVFLRTQTCFVEDEPSSDKPIALKTARSTIMEMREKERAALAAEWPWEKLQA